MARFFLGTGIMIVFLKAVGNMPYDRHLLKRLVVMNGHSNPAYSLTSQVRMGSRDDVFIVRRATK